MKQLFLYVLAVLMTSSAMAQGLVQSPDQGSPVREVLGMVPQRGPSVPEVQLGGPLLPALTANTPFVNLSSGISSGLALGKQSHQDGPLYAGPSRMAYAGVYTVGLTVQSPGFITTIPLTGAAPTSYDRVTNLQGLASKGAMNDADNWIMCFNPGGTTLMLFKYNTESWTTTGPTYPPYSPDNSYEIFDSAFDPIEGMVYGMTAKLTYGGSSASSVTPEWAKINPVTGVRNVIGNVTVSWRGIMCDAEGQFYGIDAEGVLYTIDKATGMSTRVGETGCASYYRTTGTFDTRSGEIVYATCNDDGSSLYRIDPATAAATKVYDFPQRIQLVNLYIAPPAAADDAPDVPTDLTADFEQGSLTGVVKFKAPTKTYGGEESHGDLFYYITANGTPVADGRTVYGAEVEQQITMPQNDNYIFEVYCTNSVGPGPKAKTGKIFIGNDVPTLGWTFNIAYANDAFTITWGEANATGLNGGAIDTSKVRYLLTRYPDGHQVLTAPGATTLTEAYPEPEKGGVHYYTLQAVYNDIKSNDIRTSNSLLIGTIYPAYKNTFSTNTDMIGFTSEAFSGPNDWGVFSGVTRLGYRSGEGHDNYLYTPKLYLYANRYYRFSIKASMWMNTSYPDKFDVVYGTAPTRDAMTHTILKDCQVTTASQSNPNVFETLFVPEQDGYYYIGMHVTGPANNVAFCFDDLDISAPILGGAPEPVGNLKATPAPDGSCSAKVSFTAPKKNLLGQSLSQLTRVEIRKGDEVVSDLPMTAESLTWTDKDAVPGINTYTVTPYNNDGAGTPLSTSCFVGYDIPTNVAAIEITKGESDGEVIVNWTPVTQDIHGLTVPYVAYALVRSANGQETVLGQALTETTFVDHVTSGPQTMVYYGVKAITNEGISTGWAISDQLLVGTPYETPYVESIAGGTPSSFIATRLLTQNGSWEIDYDDSFADIRSADLDNGFISFYSPYIDESGELYSGLIRLPEQMKNPTLSFYTFHFKDGENTLEPMIKGVNDASWRVLEKITLGGDSNGWRLHSYDITPWLGKVVQIGFGAATRTHVLVGIDKIMIASQLDHNIDNVQITGPSSAPIGSELAINVAYDVNARENAENFSVVLLRNGEVISTQDFDNALAGSHGVATFTDVFPQVEKQSVVYNALVEYSADEQPDNNNALNAVTVKAILPEWPVADNLVAERDGMDVKLTWAAPDMDTRPWKTYTESFEGVTTGQPDFPGWTFVDADKAPVGTAGAPDGTFPGITAGVSTAGFIGVNAADNESMFGQAHTGSAFMGALYCYDRSVNDDWLISPELKGDAQTVSIWARSMTDFYGGDRCEFLYSTSGTNLNDFVSMGGYQGIPARWVEFKLELPVGAKYVAIRCISIYQLMFCVDDVTFVPADAEHIDMQHNGYNIWRDGIRINEAPVTAAEYVDKEADENPHTYHVTAVYDLGESAVSNPAAVSKYSSLESSVRDNISIYASDGNIVVKGIEPTESVIITTVDGMNVWTGRGEVSVPMNCGFYIVRAGTRTSKIIVR